MPSASVSSSAGWVTQGHSIRDSELLADGRIRDLLGIPTDVFLKTRISSEPPPLPATHLSRASIFPELARKFDSHRVVAVTGYPKCGKTVAVAEFAANFPGDVFWFTSTHSETHPGAWFALYCLAISQHVGVTSTMPNEIRAALLGRKHALLLVIDNAQNCQDLDALSFLFEAAEASRLISLLIVGTDEPAFLSAVRSRGIPDWRLPGLSRNEARSLIRRNRNELTDDQTKALEVLRLRVDGHVGMLRLSLPAVVQIQTADQLDAFIKQISSKLEPGLEALQLAMIQRLREGLCEDELELCRRLSIVLSSFPKRVGERLWEVDRVAADFHRPWSGCVIGVFESQPNGKYDLPDLYRDGFRQEVSKNSLKLYHGAIADAFAEREGDTADLLEIHASVLHRFLSGNVSAAIEAASMYLAFAQGPHADAAKTFLIDRFEMWLASSANAPTVSATQRIRWHAIRARVYADLELGDKSEAAIRELYDLLAREPSDAAPEAILLGWTIVLVHASKEGQPELALSAVRKIEEPPVPVLAERSMPWREFMVISAFLTSTTSPLPYLLTLMKSRASELKRESLWSEMTGYEFWRAVSAAIYSRSRNRDPELESATRLSKDLDDFAKDCRAAGEFQIACLAECLLAHIFIDLLRDFDTAVNLIDATAGSVGETVDSRVRAYVCDTLGDALRCADRDEDAITAYMEAKELWPLAETPDRAETLLMLGISQAKLNRFREGRKSARAAADLHAQSYFELGMSSSQLAAVRCLLEAAGFSIHGDDPSKASRCLIGAHELLEHKHQGRSEWGALGQIAWSLSNKLKPESINPQPPIPGFSLALGDTLDGAEKMLSFAPTLMLARACAAVGRPHRALGYFEASLAECNAPELLTQVGIFALDAAIEVKDLAAAVKYCALGCHWLVDPLPESPAGSDAFVFDYIVGRTIQIASYYQDDKRALLEINCAISVLDPMVTDNAAIQLLSTALKAYRAARSDGNEAAMESAFQLAIKHSALWVARDIAWHWCFRFSPDGGAYENQFFLWHWRLCWLSLNVAPNDAVYLAGVIDQERTFWNRIPTESQTGKTHAIVRVLQPGDEPPNVVLSSLIATFAKIGCEFFPVTAVVTELVNELRLAKNSFCLTEPLDRLYIRLLDVLLHPAATHAIERLSKDVMSIDDTLGSSTITPETLDRFRGLRALSQVLQDNTPTVHAFEALLLAAPRSRELGTNSAAQLYVWLRHFAQFSPENIGIDQVFEILRSTQVTELLQAEDSLPYLKTRLAICHLTAKGFDAQLRLAKALALLRVQDSLHSPIAVSAISSAETSRDSALDELRRVVNEFQAIEKQAFDADLKDELWSCSFDLGGLRRLTGATLLLQGRDTAAKEVWLRPSIDDFRKAMHAAKSSSSAESVELVLKSAFSGRTVATALDDQPALTEFIDVINDLRSAGGWDELITRQETLESQDILILGDRKSDTRRLLKSDDEDSIQHFTNHMMQSTGWPDDRRKYVEEDIRKMARIEQEQAEYCQYLQPLQNLLHTRLPRTIYASATKYTCSCTLLKHQTQIETEDIDSVINAMKRVYCDACQLRKPSGL